MMQRAFRAFQVLAYVIVPDHDLVPFWMEAV